MDKNDVLSLVQEIIKEELEELARHAPMGHPSNLHGAEETQRDWVMRAAARNGWISSAWIADELGVPRQIIAHWGYIKRIARDPRKEPDFMKVVQEVPFQHGAIYQLIGTPPMTDAELQQVVDNEERLYKKTEGVYYPILLSPNMNASTPLIAWLNLAKMDNPQKYYDMVPVDSKQDYIFGKKPYTKGPKDTDKIISKDEWLSYVQTQMTERKKV